MYNTYCTGSFQIASLGFPSSSCFIIKIEKKRNFLPTILYFEWTNFNLIQNGGQKASPTSFFPLRSVNVKISPDNRFLDLIILPNWCKISRLYLALVPNYWTWNKNISQKNWFSWLNPYEIEVMITSLKETLDLPNFGHMITCTT